MDPETTPPNFLPIRPLLQAWRDAISKLEMTAVEGAFAFIKSLNIDVAIVGVDSAKHLRSNQQEFFRANYEQLDFRKFALNNEPFINPSSWELIK
jgi:aryl-alcohol dehydrogenase-like predicted oxidoreductase